MVQTFRSSESLPSAEYRSGCAPRVSLVIRSTEISLKGRSEPILGQSSDPRVSYEFLPGSTPIGSDDMVEILGPADTVPVSLKKNFAEMDGTFYSAKMTGNVQ